MVHNIPYYFSICVICSDLICVHHEIDNLCFISFSLDKFD